jgi:hypothetical protein
MATDAENIATIRSNLLAALATESANPKPSYSVDGQTVSWTEWRAGILKQIADLNTLAAAATPFEYVTEIYP